MDDQHKGIIDRMDTARARDRNPDRGHYIN